MQGKVIYKCSVCTYYFVEKDGQIPMNFLLTCPNCKHRLKKYVLGLSH